MTVYALVGKSGTGKSYNSLRVAKKYKIDYIIDDGILIFKDKILCGKSAKKERTKVASVKCALFFSQKHKEEVKKMLDRRKIRYILLLGTSKKMVERIAQRLEMPNISKFIDIKQVSSQKSIQYAKKVRQKQGKHVIPVPTLEVKKHFLGFFLDPIRLKFIKKNKIIIEEKTVIRPSFSFSGDYFISNRVIFDICRYEISKLKEIKKIISIKVLGAKDKKIVLIIVLTLFYPTSISSICQKTYKTLKAKIENITAYKVITVKINVKSVILKDVGEKNKK